jgi:hypothetical protein
VPRVRTTASLLAAACLLAACSDPASPETDDPTTTPTSTAGDAAPCLVSEAELSEITGVEQTLEESDLPPVDADADPEADVACSTTVDERDVTISWHLASADMAVGGALTHEELRDFVDEGGARVSEVEVASGTTAWLGSLRELGLVWATTATSQGDQWLKVEVEGDDSSTTRQQAEDEVVAVTQALVAAHAGSDQ